MEIIQGFIKQVIWIAVLLLLGSMLWHKGQKKLVVDLNWSFNSQLNKFRKRFWKEPYKSDTEWIQSITGKTIMELRFQITILREML